VVDYIKELKQVLQSLEAKKQRKICNEVFSPKPSPSTRLLPHSPIKPLSPTLVLPISPRTPLPERPYNYNIYPSYMIPNKLILSAQASYLFPGNANNGSGLEICMASSPQLAMADVTVEFSGPNVLLKTISQWVPGQVLKIVAALEKLSLEILHASISIVNGTLLNSFTIKVNVMYQFLFARASLYVKTSKGTNTCETIP
jgi:transcription factor SPEECHLESS